MNSICEGAPAGFQCSWRQALNSLEQCGLSLKYQHEQLSVPTPRTRTIHGKNWDKSTSPRQRGKSRATPSQRRPRVSLLKCQNESVETNVNERRISGTNPRSWLRTPDWFSVLILQRQCLPTVRRLNQNVLGRRADAAAEEKITHNCIQDDKLQYIISASISQCVLAVWQ